jgi:preprotein translocase subunit Sss1
MGVVLAVLLLILILGALGFAVKLLWIVALVLLAIWLIGFVVRSAEGARWYRW